MSNSPRLGVQLVPDGAMDLDQPFNNLARQLDQVLNVRVLSATTAAQPGAPASGALYILPASPSGASWAGKAAGTLALFDSGTWYFTTPAGFIVAHVADTGDLLTWSGAAWIKYETMLGAKGADVAAAATVTLANATGDFIHVTGTGGPITSFGVAKAGLERALVHDAAHTLTHGANIINLTGANLTTAAGDISRWRSEGAGVWRMVAYHRADGSLPGYKPVINISAAFNNISMRWDGGGNIIGRIDATDFTLWSNGNFSPESKVNKAGDTMTGGLFAPTFTAGGMSLQGTNSGAGASYSVLDFYPNKYMGYAISTDRFELFNAGLSVGGDISTTRTIRPATFTVATLPATGLMAGMRATVSDATAPTYLGALTGGGTVTCGVLYNGTAWVST